jgi:hypothetical protein
MLAQADFQRALALALGEFAAAWTIVGDCAPVDRFDTSHWGSGPQGFQVTLRHRVTGHLKVLGRRGTYEPGASVHPAVALSLIGAYRHGNPEPIRRYLEEIGVAAVNAADARQFFHHPSAAPPSRASSAEPARLLAAGLAVAAVTSEPPAASSVGEVDGADADIASQPRRAGAARSWSLSLRRPKLPAPAIGAHPSREIPPAPVPSIVRRSVRVPPTVEPRRPMLGRLRRELEIWYWRRAASSGPDKDKWHARD